MKVRAIAAPSHESNAIGSVELECTPQGLNMLYLGVGSYAEGYAPGALTSGTQVFAPWEQVEDVRVHGDHVLIAVTETLTPHHKLWLTNFSDGSEQGTLASSPELRKRRRLIRGAALVLMVTVALSLGSQLPHWSKDIGQLGALIIGCGGAVIVLLLGVFAEFFFLPRGLSSQDAQRLFVADLAHFRPAPVREGPGKPGPEQALDWSELIRVLPRSSLAIIIVLTATSLAFILTSTWMLRGPQPQAVVAAAPEPPPIIPAAPPPAAAPPVESASAMAAAQTTAPPAASAEPAPSAESASPGDACKCDRSDSALYQVAFPRLSTLLIAQSMRSHKDHHHLELELGVVNNGKETLDEVNLLVHFYEGEDKRHTKDRPLHYGSKLRPGQAIKWHVEARGETFLVHNPVNDVLDPDKDELAAADDFADLLNANHRPVRLHGAMMLAFANDPRAKGGTLKLREALRDNEAPYLDRLMMALTDMATCDWRVSESGRVRQVNACVYNRSAVRKQDLGMKVRALDRVFDHRSPVAAPPLIIAEKTWKLDDAFEPGEGRVIGVQFDTDNPDGKLPKGFEVFVDREELLY